MSVVAMYVDGNSVSAKQLMSLKKAIGIGLSELKAAITQGKPIYVKDAYSESAADMFRRILSSAVESKVAVKLYELYGNVDLETYIRSDADCISIDDLLSTTKPYRTKSFPIDKIMVMRKDACKVPEDPELTKRQHPALFNPITEVDKAAAALEVVLRRQRIGHPPSGPPMNWLFRADEADIKEVRSRWDLPEVYIEFLEKFSPFGLDFEAEDNLYWQPVTLFGAHDLISGQDGYSFNSVEGTGNEDWPRSYVVIGHTGYDPFVIDLNQISNGDAPVLHSIHGMGKWEFGPVEDSFIKFLLSLSEEQV